MPRVSKRQADTAVSPVKEVISKGGWIPGHLVDEQINWFYNELGIDDVYFQLEQVSVIAGHITSLYAAKVAAHSREDKREEIRLDMEAHDHAIYIDTSEPGKSAIDGPRYETRLESKYLDGSFVNKNFRVETFPLARQPRRLYLAQIIPALLLCLPVPVCRPDC